MRNFRGRSRPPGGGLGFLGARRFLHRHPQLFPGNSPRGNGSDGGLIQRPVEHFQFLADTLCVTLRQLERFLRAFVALLGADHPLLCDRQALFQCGHLPLQIGNFRRFQRLGVRLNFGFYNLREEIAERRSSAVNGLKKSREVTAQTILESTPGMLRFPRSFAGIFPPESCTCGRAASFPP